MKLPTDLILEGTMLKNIPNNALRQAELLAKLVEMAGRGITPDGDEDTSFAGYSDGAVTFARDHWL